MISGKTTLIAHIGDPTETFTYTLTDGDGNSVGFGEGNFTALFKSMELDQIRRGALSVETEPAE